MLNFTDISMKETRYYQDAVAEGRVEGWQKSEAAMLLGQLERTTARYPNPPASALPPPTLKPCWRGPSVCWMPAVWMRFGALGKSLGA